uniref:hypothetical protein n=1 Tax=Cronobacter sakazakii TaxID=28141 RepID=UPI001F36405C
MIMIHHHNIIFKATPGPRLVNTSIIYAWCPFLINKQGEANIIYLVKLLFNTRNNIYTRQFPKDYGLNDYDSS